MGLIAMLPLASISKVPAAAAGDDAGDDAGGGEALRSEGRPCRLMWMAGDEDDWLPGGVSRTEDEETL